MAISMITNGYIGPLETASDLIDLGMAWRNRFVGETKEYLALIAAVIERNAPIYPNINERGLICAMIDREALIYMILEILARGNVVEASADLF
jgi:hypothetical protein